MYGSPETTSKCSGNELFHPVAKSVRCIFTAKLEAQTLVILTAKVWPSSPDADTRTATLLLNVLLNGNVKVVVGRILPGTLTHPCCKAEMKI